jgi:hypothetical protein
MTERTGTESPIERLPHAAAAVLGAAAVFQPELFWQSLRPAEALALLKAAPKVAGPWEPYVLGLSIQRRGCRESYIYATREHDALPRLWYATATKQTYETQEAAAVATDAVLKEKGWLLDV